MAIIIPQLSTAEIFNIPSKAEQIVYKALQNQIPDNWLVIHTLEFVIQHPKYESHADREADFVVFTPEYGVLVVEVKGGGIGYDKEIDSWHSIDRYGNKHDIKNPLRQSKDAKYEIRRHLNSRMIGKNLLVAHAALFPDIDDAGPLNGHDSPIEILGTNNVLSDIKSWVESIFKYWAGKEPNFNPLGSLGISIAKDIYGKKATIKSSLSVAIKRELQIQIELTNQQKNILRQLKRRSKAIIEGGAGTGKTVLALDHAQNLATQGLKVLLLCYNKQLANLLKRRCLGIDNLHAMDFHQLCDWRIRQVKNNTRRDLISESRLQYPTSNECEVLMPDALINSYDIVPLEYDAIIIDEGQDFSDEYWLSIDLLFESQNTKSRLYIFQDGNQAIYGSSSDLPIDEVPLYLIDNCRNTRPIHELAYQYYKGEDIEAPDIEGESIKYLIEDSAKKQATIIEKKVSELINVENVEAKDISVIIIGDFKHAEYLLQNTKNSKRWAFKDYSPQKHVLVETAKRFKGLESSIILLWILDEFSVDEKLLYVSISRARFRLWIVCTETINEKINMLSNN